MKKVGIEKRGCRFVFWRALVFPVIVGLLIGFAGGAAALHLGQPTAAAQPIPTPAPTLAPTGPTRVVILLLDGGGDSIVGVWQWWSDPLGDAGKAACVLSPGTRIAPSGRTVAEMMNLAMAAGDDAWVAKNTRDFAGDCLLGQTSAADEVIFVSEAGLTELVDALGGIHVDKQKMGGSEAWDYLAQSTADPAVIQRRQRAVWAALKAAVRRTPGPACGEIVSADELFRSIPRRENACSQLETLLAQTPPFIATP
jgi:hypothetical protein